MIIRKSILQSMLSPLLKVPLNIHYGSLVLAYDLASEKVFYRPYGLQSHQAEQSQFQKISVFWVLDYQRFPCQNFELIQTIVLRWTGDKIFHRANSDRQTICRQQGKPPPELDFGRQANKFFCIYVLHPNNIPIRYLDQTTGMTGALNVALLNKLLLILLALPVSCFCGNYFDIWQWAKMPQSRRVAARP